MSNITERLVEAAKLYPIIEDQPYSLFVDSLAEIERLQEQVNVPKGWKLVPIEPNQWMRTQGEEGFESCSVIETWARMLRAAPAHACKSNVTWVNVTERDELVDSIYLDLGGRFNFIVDSPRDMVAYLVDAGLIATPTKANEQAKEVYITPGEEEAWREIEKKSLISRNPAV